MMLVSFSLQSGHEPAPGGGGGLGGESGWMTYTADTMPPEAKMVDAMACRPVASG
jgi:hypothetical protein